MANPSLSPDGSRVAFSRVVGGNWDVWLIDMQGAVSQLTSALPLDGNPVWSKDGRRVFYQSNPSNIYSRSVIDGTPEEVVLREPTMIYPSAVSPDGSVLLYTRATGMSTDLWYVSLGADRTPHPFVHTAFHERDGQFLLTGSGSRIKRATPAISKSTSSRFPARVIGFKSHRAVGSKCAGQGTDRNCFTLPPISD